MRMDGRRRKRLESSIARIVVGVLHTICILACLESKVLCVEHRGAIPDIQNILCGQRLESPLVWVQFSPTGLGSFASCGYRGVTRVQPCLGKFVL